MTHLKTHGSLSAILAGAFVLIAALCLAGRPAHAQQADVPTAKPAYSPYFSGAFWEPSFRLAPTINANDESGWAMDIGLRQSFPLGLADTRLSYRYDEFEASIPVTGHTLHLGIGLHPLYFFILRNDFWGWILAGAYFEAGFGGELVTTDEGDAIASELEVVWSVGGGMDIPLWNPDVGYALWINLLYRYQSIVGDVSSLDLGLHTFFVGLGWRTNGLLF